MLCNNEMIIIYDDYINMIILILNINDHVRNSPKNVNLLDLTIHFKWTKFNITVSNDKHTNI